MRHLDTLDLRGITVALASTRPDDRHATSRDLLAAMAHVPIESITREPCPRCGQPHGRLSTSAGSASASHAGGRTVVAFARPHVTTGPIGIDIEDATEADAKLAGLSTILDVTFSSALDAVRRWTEVEAVLKADGRGLEVDARSVRFEESGGGLLAWVDDRPDRRYELDALPLDAPLVGSLARPARQI